MYSVLQEMLIQRYINTACTDKRPTNKQRDLGIIVTEDLKCTTNVRDVSSKANTMLGYVKRSSFDMRDP